MDTIGFKLPGNRGIVQCPMLGVDETGAWLIECIGKQSANIVECWYDETGGAIVVRYRGNRDRKYSIRFELTDPS